MWEDQLWNEMKRIRKNVNIFLGRTDFPESSFNTKNYRQAWADTDENGEEYEISMEIPGINKEDIELQVVEHRLIIKAEKKQEIEKNEKTDEGVQHYRFMKRYAGFYRSFDLPEDANLSEIDAEYKNGILNISVPKKKEKKKKNLVEIR